MTLTSAAVLITEAQQRAFLRNDPAAAERLGYLARATEREIAYDRNVELGAPIVRRRTDAPPGATVGWYFRFDAHTRAARRARGLGCADGLLERVPEDGGGPPSSHTNDGTYAELDKFAEGA